MLHVYYSNEKDYKEYFNKIKTVKEVSDEKDFDDYHEKFATGQQKKRDKIVTDILEYYKDNYNSKIQYNKMYKERIAELCLKFIEISFLMFFFLIVIVLVCDNLRDSIQGLVSLLTICVSMLGLIVGIFKIVTKYIFPKKEEEYITQIVSSIQANDYNTKKAYMDYHKHTTEESEEG